MAPSQRGVFLIPLFQHLLLWVRSCLSVGGYEGFSVKVDGIIHFNAAFLGNSSPDLSAGISNGSVSSVTSFCSVPHAGESAIDFQGALPIAPGTQGTVLPLWDGRKWVTGARWVLTGCDASSAAWS